ncbi:MAG: hypothetical protein KF832_03130 [Caldilineaceae bacterium]|nr:hypothetical protein [Caldilineaceae bacterium]
MVSKALLRFARAMVQTALSQLTQQFNVVQQQAHRPMQMMIQQVTNGVWVGRGADAFVQEVSSLAMPKVDQIGQRITRTQKNIQFACDCIDKADQQVRTKVSALSDTFGSIF